MYIFFSVIYFLFLNNNSYGAHIHTPTNSQTIDYFSQLPTEIITKIFFSLIEKNDFKALHAILCTKKISMR